MFTRRQFTQSLAAAAAIGSRSAWAQSPSLTYVGWSQDEAASKATLATMFDAFRASNPDVKLETVGFPWAQMQQNILLRLRSGQPLDVVQMAERWLPQFASTGKMVNISEVFGKGQLEKIIHPGVLRLGMVKDKQYGLPWTAGSIGMVANDKVLKDCGISSTPKTVDAFIECLKTIKKAQPLVVPYALTTKNNSSMCPDFQVWLWTFGGELFNQDGKVVVNSPAAVKALTFLTDLVKDGLAAKDIDRPDARRLYAQHLTAFYNDAPLARGIARSNSGKGVEFDINVKPIATPVLKHGDSPQSFGWAHLLTMFVDPKNPTLTQQSPSTKLISQLALSDNTQLLYYKEQGLFPVTNSALAKLTHDPYVTAWTQYSKGAQRDEVSQWTTSADPVVIIGEEVQSALIGQKTPANAIETMAKRLEMKMAELAKS